MYFPQNNRYCIVQSGFSILWGSTWMWLSTSQWAPSTAAALKVLNEEFLTSSSQPVDVPKSTVRKPVSALGKGLSELLPASSSAWHRQRAWIWTPIRDKCYCPGEYIVSVCQYREHRKWKYSASAPPIPFLKSQDCIKNHKTDLKYSILGYLSLWFRDFNKYLLGLELFPTTKMLKPCTLKLAHQFFRSLFNSIPCMYVNV